MDFLGPSAISSINALSKPEASLRPFQRVSAQVLEVTGTTALLSVEGIPIVAQLASADQATELLNRQTAQFVVTQLTKQKITLRMIKDDSAQTALTGSASNAPELAVRLLEQNHIPPTVNNLMMARSILRQHLPITDNLLQELMEALSEYGSWGSAEADVAAALKAAKLPVSAQTIALVSRQPTKISDSISQLITLLNDTARPDLPAEILKQLEFNMWLLNGMILDGDEETSSLAEQLKAALETLGRSLENTLLEGSQNPEAVSSEISLASLARLQKMMEQIGKNQAAESIGKFLEDMRLNQFLNAKPDWLDINIPIHNVRITERFSTARLRIARDAKSASRKIDPASTRLMLQVDINPGETVEVDLVVMGKQIRTSVTAPNPGWGEQAESELPSLEQGLQSLGFTLKEAQVRIGEPPVFTDLRLVPESEYLMTVDIEV